MANFELDKLPENRKRIYLSDLYNKILDGNLSPDEMLFIAGLIKYLAVNPLTKINLRVMNDKFLASLKITTVDNFLIYFTLNFYQSITLENTKITHASRAH